MAAEEPVAEQTVTEESVAEEPVTEEPVAEESEAEEPKECGTVVDIATVTDAEMLEYFGGRKLPPAMHGIRERGFQKECIDGWARRCVNNHKKAEDEYATINHTLEKRRTPEPWGKWGWVQREGADLSTMKSACYTLEGGSWAGRQPKWRHMGQK